MPQLLKNEGFYSNSKWRLGKNHFSKVKVNAFRNDLHAEMTMYPKVGNEMFMLTIPDARRTNLGLHLSDKWIITEKVNVETGGRIDFSFSEITTSIGKQTLTSFYSDSPSKEHFAWNAFVQPVFMVNKLFSLYGGISRASRAPTLQELYGFYLFNRMDNYDFIGNPDVLPEKSWNFNLGFSFNVNKVSLEGKVYSYFFSDYIVGEKREGYGAMTIGASGVKSYVNLSSAVLSGVELNGVFDVTKNIRFNTKNSFSYGRDNDGDALPMIPPFKSINQLKYNLKGYVFQVEYVGGAGQKNVDYEKYGENHSNDFHILNTGISKVFNVKRFSYVVMLSVNNVFDRVYYEHLDLMRIPRQGRSFELKFTFSF